MQKTIKGSLWSWLVPAVLCIAVIVILFWQAQGRTIFYLYEAIVLVVGLLFVGGGLTTAIIMDDQGITYKSFFSSKQILWTDLQKAEFDLGTRVVSSLQDVGGTMQRRNTVQSYASLALWDNKNFTINPILINMKSFPKNSISEVATFMASKVDTAKMPTLSNYLTNN